MSKGFVLGFLSLVVIAWAFQTGINTGKSQCYPYSVPHELAK